MKAVEILAQAHDERDANYDRALWLIDQMARGLIAPERVTADLQARTWELAAGAVAPACFPAPAGAPLRVEGGIEGLRRLAALEAALEAEETHKNGEG